MTVTKTVKTLSGKEVELAYSNEVLLENQDAVEKGKQELRDMRQKLMKIEDKNKCLRVQFLDWLSDKLLNWSNKVHEAACRIDSPCIIKVEPRKKEDSKAAKEAKELNRLRDFLKDSREQNHKLASEKAELQQMIKKDIENSSGDQV